MDESSGKNTTVTRRQTLRDMGAAGLGLTALGGGLEALLARRRRRRPRTARSKDIEHVIFLIQENRSFDHYFGTLSGVRGFGDKRGAAAFRRRNPEARRSSRSSSAARSSACPTSPTTGARSTVPGTAARWTGSGHESSTNGATAPRGDETMGYYTRSQLSFYYSLADAFTICDGYHCSVIGPTDPNRLMSMSASLDPGGRQRRPAAGDAGGHATPSGQFTWTTMPERLQSQGVSWKVYQDPAGGVFDNVLPYFAVQQTKPGELAGGPTRRYPDDFMADIQHNTLPSVSWVLTNLAETEHPGFSAAVSGEIARARSSRRSCPIPRCGEDRAVHHLGRERGLLRSRRRRRRAPKGTKGEYLTRRQPPGGGQRDPRADRARLPRADAHRLPVHPRRPRLLGHVRPHLDAALRRDALRGGGAQPVGHGGVA